VPAANAGSITEAGKAIGSVSEIKVNGTEDGYVKLEIGSGTYHFAVPKPAN